MSYEYVIQQNFGYGDGWEDVSAESTVADANRTLRDYRANQPEFPARCIKRRVRK